MSKGLPTPKQRMTKSRTGRRRAHHFTKLQKAVNRQSPIKVILPSKLKALNKVSVVKTTPKKTLKNKK